MRTQSTDCGNKTTTGARGVLSSFPSVPNKFPKVQNFPWTFEFQTLSRHSPKRKIANANATQLVERGQMMCNCAEWWERPGGALPSPPRLPSSQRGRCRGRRPLPVLSPQASGGSGLRQTSRQAPMRGGLRSQPGEKLAPEWRHLFPPRQPPTSASGQAGPGAPRFCCFCQNYKWIPVEVIRSLCRAAGSQQGICGRRCEDRPGHSTADQCTARTGPETADICGDRSQERSAPIKALVIMPK